MSILPKFIPLSYALVRLCVFTFVWLILTQFNLGSWLFGIILVPLATLVSLYLFKPNRSYYTKINLTFLPVFLLYFFKESILGGINTAKLAFGPKSKLKPTIVEMSVNIQYESARIVFAQIVSLLPGTLSVNLSDTHLLVHTLGQNKTDTLASLDQCEQMMKKLFRAI